MSAPRVAGAPHRRDGLVEPVGHDAEVDDLAALARAPAPWWRSRSSRRSRPTPGSAPGITSSSPVASTATLGRRCTGTVGWFMAAASARSRSVRRRPLREQDRAAREIEAGDADVLALAGRRWSTTTVSPSRVVFSWITMVSAPGGTHAAGEDARRFAGADRALERMPGGDFADELEPRRRGRDIGGAHRIAVHGGDVGRRLRAQRREVGGEHAAVRVRERRGFGRQRLGVREHARERLRDRHQRHGSTPSPGSGPTCRRSSRSGGCPRCACRARPP